jgi:hypothetical protein
MRWTHLSTETALDFLEHRVDTGQALLWKLHLKECTLCSRYLAGWQHFLTALKRFSLRNAPEQDVERAIEMFPHRSDELGRTIPCILATIVFDSSSQPFPAGARGVPVPARDLVLEAEDFDLHVQIRGAREHREILGQVLSRRREDFADAVRFHLLRNGEELQAADADTLGEFNFTAVPWGDLSLQVDLPHLTIIGALNVKPQ